MPHSKSSVGSGASSSASMRKLKPIEVSFPRRIRSFSSSSIVAMRAFSFSSEGTSGNGTRWARGNLSSREQSQRVQIF